MGSLTRGGHTNDNGLSSRGFPLSSFTREEGVSIGSRRNHDLSETRADGPIDDIRRYVEAVRKPIGAVATRGQHSKSNPRIGGAGSTGRSKSIDVCESMSGRGKLGSNNRLAAIRVTRRFLVRPQPVP
jgi:hypothetical protein